MKNNLYDKILINFFNNSGNFIIISDDNIISSTIKNIPKTIGIKFNQIENFYTIEDGINALQKSFQIYKNIILFIENNISGKLVLQHIPLIKKAYKDYNLKIICLSSETTKEYIVLMNEMGVDKIIIKPVSFNSLVEKIALTLKPNTSLYNDIDCAKKEIENGNFSQAKKYVSKILLQKPDSAIGLILRGEIAESENKFIEAESFYKKAYEENKLYIEPLKKLALLYKKINKSNNYINTLLMLDKISPMNFDRKVELGDAFIEINDKDNADKYLQQALKLVKKQSDNLISSAYMKISQKMKNIDKEKSLELAQKSLSFKDGKFDKSDIWLFNEMGLQYKQNNQFEKATHCYLEALEISPQDSIILYNLGVSYYLLGKYESSKKCFNNALEFSKGEIIQSEQICYNISLSFFKCKDYLNALTYVKMGLNYNEFHPELISLYNEIKPFI